MSNHDVSGNKGQANGTRMMIKRDQCSPWNKTTGSNIVFCEYFASRMCGMPFHLKIWKFLVCSTFAMTINTKYDQTPQQTRLYSSKPAVFNHKQLYVVYLRVKVQKEP